MALPEFEATGYLAPGIHAASLSEVETRFGAGSALRQRQIGLLREVVAAAESYPTIKRILLWGSFVTAKPEPADLDYSIVVSVDHRRTRIASGHRRFFVPLEARIYYAVDRGYLVIKDYPLEVYLELLEFTCRDRDLFPRGIVEIHVRGEFAGEQP